MKIRLTRPIIFFLTLTNIEKKYAGGTNNPQNNPAPYTVCGYPYSATPGSTFVYHTSDFYMSTTMIQTQIVASTSYSAINLYWNAIIANPLSLSPPVQGQRHTYDDSPNPSETWGAWGLFYVIDDIAKLAIFVNQNEGVIGGSPVLNSVYLNKAMQRDTTDMGTIIPNSVLGGTVSDPFSYRYKLGFWATNIFDETLSVPGYNDYRPAGGYPCTTAANTPNGQTTAVSGTYTPYALGYGGIMVGLLPNRINYIIFSDSDDFIWAPGARESIKLQNFCTAGPY